MNVLKKIGFIALLAGILFALRPSWFMGLFSGKASPEEEVPTSQTAKAEGDTLSQAARNAQNAKEYYNDRNTPTLLAKNNKATSSNTVVSEEGITQYAEGYGPKDFGKAFEPEQRGKTSDELPSPGGIWDDLLQLKFKIQYDESVDDVVFKPQFTDKIRRHAGKTIEIPGYMIPAEIVAGAMGSSANRAGMFMFSAYPNQSCFFCGGAGPESVMEAYPKKPLSYHKDQVKLRGKLELNESDPLRMAYILRDVQLVE